jgi:DNA-binding NarL/FixJ family response regulator
LADALVDLGLAEEAEQVIARSVAWQDRSALGRPEYLRLRRVRGLLGTGDVAAARAELADVREVVCGIGFVFAEIEVSLLAARIAEAEQDPTAARAAFDDATGRAAVVGVRSLQAWAAHVEGRVARLENRLGAAEDAQHRALAVCVEHGYIGRGADVLESLAGLAALGESWAEAARLYGAASALRESCGVVRSALDEPAVTANLAAAEQALGADGLAAALAAGTTLDLAGAAGYASRARGERKRPSSGWDSLTPTERQIVELVAEGLTNAAIGERLFITTGTTKVHVHNIFTKLGISRRSELAAQATQRRYGG